MKRLLALVALVFTLSGCAAVQAWWASFQADPVAQVQTFETDTQIVISNLTTAWNIIVVFLPPTVVPQAQQQFNNAIAAANHVLQALQNLVQAAIDAKNNAPDFSAALLDVSNAVQQIVAIVTLYQNQQVQPAGAPKLAQSQALIDAQAELTVLQHFVVKVR